MGQRSWRAKDWPCNPLTKSGLVIAGRLFQLIIKSSAYTQVTKSGGKNEQAIDPKRDVETWNGLFDIPGGPRANIIIMDGKLILADFRDTGAPTVQNLSNALLTGQMVWEELNT